MQLAQRFKALADTNRLRALHALRRGELCVCQLTELLELAPSTTSKHLSLLAQAGLVQGRKRGRWMFYRLSGEEAPASTRTLLAAVAMLLADEPDAGRDDARLAEILKTDPETLCRAQNARAKTAGNAGSGWFPELAAAIDDLLAASHEIESARRTPLAALAEIVVERLAAGKPARLVFICTHNSRRSHIAQIWAQAAADYFGLAGVETYSGGTEATAFHPNAVTAMARAGFRLERTGAGGNPTYRVQWRSHAGATAFSKMYDQPPNPAADFCAVMTCAEADQACPAVAGAAARIALPFTDPKAADGAPDQDAVYDARCRQIGGEMLYAFALAAKRLQAPK